MGAEGPTLQATERANSRPVARTERSDQGDPSADARYNQRLVLRTLYDLGPISRAEVARLTGLTRTTVGDVVGELLADGLVEEVGRGPSSGGKAPILLERRRRRAPRHRARPRRAARSPARSSTSAARSGAASSCRSRAATATRRSQLVYRLVDELLDAGDGPLLGIGVGTPGLVDTRTGTIRWAVNLDWQDLPLGELLRERYGLPVNVANDSQAAALAEYTFAGERHAPARTWSRSRSGAASAPGWSSAASCSRATASAPARSATRRRRRRRACRCGRFGCLETVASAPAIAARARRSSGELDAPTLDDVRAALEAGDEPPVADGASAGRCARPRDRRPDRRPRRPRIVLLGAGDRARRAVARGRPRRGARRALALLAARRRDRTSAAATRRRDARRVRPADDPRARPEPRPDDRRTRDLGTTRTDRRRLLAGVDVGGSKIAVLVVDARPRGPRPPPRPDRVGDAARRRGPDRRGASTPRCARPALRATTSAAIGVGVPGRVDRATGTVTLAVNLGWQRPAARRRCSRRALGVPSRVENDVRAAAAGLHERRVLGDVDDLVYLSVGTGSRPASSSTAAPPRARGLAGEIGHVVLEPNGPRCACGLRRLLRGPRLGPRRRVAGRGRLRRRPPGAPSATSTGHRRRRLPRRRGRRRARARDRRRAGRWVARAVHALVMAYDVGASSSAAASRAPAPRSSSPSSRPRRASGRVRARPRGAAPPTWSSCCRPMPMPARGAP